MREEAAQHLLQEGPEAPASDVESARELKPFPEAGLPPWRQLLAVLGTSCLAAVLLLLGHHENLPQAGSGTSGNLIGLNGAGQVAAYDEPMASALAGLVKLSECGALPGIYASVANGCGRSAVSGQQTSCERAGIMVPHGTVHLVVAQDLHSFADPIFGFVARFQGAAASKSGCLVVFRAAAGGSEFVTLGGADSTVPLGGADEASCAGCRVDRRTRQIWDAGRSSFFDSLKALNCGRGSELIFAGRGIGGAVAALAMHEARLAGLKILPSYLFGSRRPGNAAFVRQLTRLVGRVVFHVTYDHDIGARRPLAGKEDEYESLGTEVHYPPLSKAGEYEVCSTPGPSCGIRKYQPRDLTEGGSCFCPVATGSSFCAFPKFVDACYLGLGYESFQGLSQETYDEAVAPSSTTSTSPRPVQEVDWEAVGTTSRPKVAAPSDEEITSQFSEARARLLAAMSKITSCGPTAGIESAAMNTCTKYGTKLGIVCSVGLFRTFSTTDEGVKDADFGFALAYTSAGAGKPAYFVAFRGTSYGSIGHANQQRNMQMELVPYFESACPGAMAHRGYAATWDKLKEKVLHTVSALGAERGSTVDVTGFALGGAVAQLAIYELALAGYKPRLTYLFEPPRVTNGALTSCIRDALDRSVPWFRITHQRDPIPVFPNRPGYADMDYEVHFPGDTTKGMQICTGHRRQPCGTTQYQGRNMSMAKYHCSNPLAPEGDLCSFGEGNAEFFATCYLGASV